MQPYTPLPIVSSVYKIVKLICPISDPLQECPIWVDESAFFDRHLTTIHRPSSPLQGGPDDPLGLSVESAS